VWTVCPSYMAKDMVCLSFLCMSYIISGFYCTKLLLLFCPQVGRVWTVYLSW